MENSPKENFKISREYLNPSPRNLTHAIRGVLMEEFNSQCGYCGSKLDLMVAEIDQFYPRSGFPEMASNPENLILSCHSCNRLKNNQFPVDEDGTPLLIHPKRDHFKDHVKIDKDGKAVPLTKKGKITIETFKLNRATLIEDRKVKKIEEDLIQSYRKGNEEYFKVFQENIILSQRAE